MPLKHNITDVRLLNLSETAYWREHLAKNGDSISTNMSSLHIENMKNTGFTRLKRSTYQWRLQGFIYLCDCGKCRTILPNVAHLLVRMRPSCRTFFRRNAPIVAYIFFNVPMWPKNALYIQDCLRFSWTIPDHCIICFYRTSSFFCS